LLFDDVVAGGHKAFISTVGGSSLGKMLIKLAQAGKIKTINLVRKEYHVKELQELGADVVLNTTSPDFDEKLKCAIRDIQPTICLDCLGGDLPVKVLDCMPYGSNLVIYGTKVSHVLSGISVTSLMRDDKVIRGFVLMNKVKDYTSD